ncbi:MAG: phosphoribosylanthranilate isomerase [Saprospiraceae bacterium]
MRVRVKICCISSAQEAQMAIQAGADALGLVGPMPSGPGVIDDALIQKIAATLPPAIGSFLLTSETRADAVIAHHQKVHTNTIQLVDALEGEAYEQIRVALPQVKLVQVIHVLDQASVDEALRVAPMVDALLLDSGNPNAAVKELGGTGRTHNWTLSRMIVENSFKPVFLAGGLHAGNIREAIEQVAPFGVDLCSGVRTNKQLDPHKLKRFFEEISI